MRTRNGPKRGWQSAAGIACAAGFCLAFGADKPAASPTSGSVVSYQESRGSGIVYLEEKGGITSAVTSAIVQEPAKPKALAKAPVAVTKPAAPPKLARGIAPASATKP